MIADLVISQKKRGGGERGDTMALSPESFLMNLFNWEFCKNIINIKIHPQATPSHN
jgi:hypothetical protein